MTARRILLFECTLVGASIAALLAAASLGMGVTWDESLYFAFSDSVRAWFAGGPAWDRASVLQAWAHSPYHNPHPPLPKVLSALTASAFEGVLPFPLTYRLAYHIRHAIGLALAYGLLRADHSRVMAAAAVAFVLLQPRVFGEMMIGTTDASVAICWLLLALLAWRIVGDGRPPAARGMRIVFLVVYGLAVATKFTGALALAPIGAYLVLRRGWRELPFVLVTVAFGLGFLVATSPETWGTPFTAAGHYVMYPFTRTSIPMTIQFLGARYVSDVPWTYFGVMSVVTFPVALWLLLGGLVYLRRPDRELALALLVPLAFWLVVVHLPGTPRHDGVRQFVAVYPLLALVSWLGLRGAAEEALRGHGVQAAAWFRTAAVSAATASLAASLWRSHPHELSYYNGLIRGIRGAEAAGMEMCYFLESVDPLFLRAMNRHLGSGQTVGMEPYWPDLLRTYQRHGLLRHDVRIHPGGAPAPDYLVFVRRRSRIDDAAYRAMPALHETTYDGVSLAKLVRLTP